MGWRQHVVSPESSLLKAMELIDKNGSRFALVADENGLLLGVATDGNIRRGLLAGKGVQARIDTVMNSSPVTAAPKASRHSVLKRMRAEDLTHIPVVDESGRLIDLWSLKDLQQSPNYENPVVLMAGGLGSRLGELTRNCPKPMLQVGGKPLLEIVLQNFLECGFKQFFISVNYKAEQVEEYFKDGSQWGAIVKYLRETKPLGTAGALSLLPHSLSLPVIVMNGDILTRLRGDILIDAHEDSGAAATMVLKSYECHIPYGVAECSADGTLMAIREKPRVSFPVSAGINVLSPEVLNRIPKDTRYDMPDLFHTLLRDGENVRTFISTEYWLDIGQILDYEKANREYAQHFTDARQ